MPTAKKRVNLTIDEELYDNFEALKKFRKDSSISSIILDLAKEGLEMNEDLYFVELAESRLHEKKVSHDKAWTRKK